MKYTLTFVSLLFINMLSAQTILVDEDFTNGIPSTWTIVDVDQNTPVLTQFNQAWIGYTNSFDTCAASTSYYTDTSKSSSDYLITPALNLQISNTISWQSKSLDGSYPDSYVVLISTTDTSISSFTDTLKIVYNEAPYWQNYWYVLDQFGYTNQTIYIAFKNFTKNGYVLQIDNVKVMENDPASVKNESKEEILNVYPNPVNEMLYIDSQNLTNIKIYNLNGELMIESKSSQINCSQLTSGIYMANIFTANGVFQKKIIKL